LINRWHKCIQGTCFYRFFVNKIAITTGSSVSYIDPLFNQYLHAAPVHTALGRCSIQTVSIDNNYNECSESRLTYGMSGSMMAVMRDFLAKACSAVCP